MHAASPPLAVVLVAVVPNIAVWRGVKGGARKLGASAQRTPRHCLAPAAASVQQRQRQPQRSALGTPRTVRAPPPCHCSTGPRKSRRWRRPAPVMRGSSLRAPGRSHARRRCVGIYRPLPQPTHLLADAVLQVGGPVAHVPRAVRGLKRAVALRGRRGRWARETVRKRSAGGRGRASSPLNLP